MVKLRRSNCESQKDRSGRSDHSCNQSNDSETEFQNISCLKNPSAFREFFSKIANLKNRTKNDCTRTIDVPKLLRTVRRGPKRFECKVRPRAGSELMNHLRLIAQIPFSLLIPFDLPISFSQFP